MKPVTKERLIKTLDRISELRRQHTHRDIEIVSAFARLGLHSMCAETFGQETSKTERLIKTLDHIRELRRQDTHRDIEIVSVFARLGLHSMCAEAFGQETSKTELGRANITANYHEFSIEEREVIFERLRKEMDRWGDRTEKVFALQAKHQISGLEERVYQDEDHQLTTFWQSEDLRLIEQDLVVLRQEKPKVVQFFIDAIARNNLKVWLRDKDDSVGWKPIDSSQVMEIFHTGWHDWATLYIWNSNEIFLDMGVGLEGDSCDTFRHWFAASKRTPSL